MRIRFLILLSLLSYFGLRAQSPFDYGKNKQVYFMSDSARNAFGIREIVEITRYPVGETGGMRESWDIMTWRFEERNVTCGWSIVNDTIDKFNYDTIINHNNWINGSSYSLLDGTLTEYGGGGYGTFEYTTFTERNDSCSLSHTELTGHCGSNCWTQQRKNVIDQRGRILYTVYFQPEYPSDENEGADTLQMQERDRAIDTVFYQYDAYGRLVATGKGNAMPATDVRYLFGYQGYIDRKEQFHQYYIEGSTMEKYIRTRLGYIPQLLIVEISKYSAVGFIYNDANKKYYEYSTVDLER